MTAFLVFAGVLTAVVVIPVLVGKCIRRGMGGDEFDWSVDDDDGGFFDREQDRERGW